jgi:putative acetyltransferase
MILIRPVQLEELQAVKRVILSVAYNIYGWEGTLEESIRHFEASDEFADMDDVQSHYFDNGGYFLVALDGAQVIGSGAVRRLDAQTAELKRMWLLEDYHGRGIGYRILTRLFDFTRSQGYTRVRLQTGSKQTRAIAFYRKAGFYVIPAYNEDFDEVSMEIAL